MFGKLLSEVQEEKYLRFIISNDLKSGQNTTVAQKANRMLEFIAKNYQNIRNHIDPL